MSNSTATIGSVGAITDLYVNSTRQLLLCGTGLGFFMYDVVKNKHTIFRDFSGDGGIKLIRILGTSNIFGFVTNNKPKEVVVWDDFQNARVCTLEFDHEIKNLLMTHKHIIIIESEKISIYGLVEKKLLKEMQTGRNPRGLCLMANDDLVLFPSSIDGNICMYSITTDKLGEEIKAHQNEIECMDLSADLQTLFTASTQGTLIRGHNIANQEKTYEFRRGANNAKIYCIASDTDNKHLAVTSNTGTIHLYTLDTKGGVKNKESTLGYFKNYLPEYFSSEWSNTTISTKNTQRSVASFKEINSSLYLIVAFLDGAYFKYKIDLASGSVGMVKHISLVRND